MTILQPAVNLLQHGPCPGPVPTSAAHAERCRACGKCGALARLLNPARIEGTANRGFSQAAAPANG